MIPTAVPAQEDATASRLSCRNAAIDLQVASAQPKTAGETSSAAYTVELLAKILVEPSPTCYEAERLPLKMQGKLSSDARLKGFETAYTHASFLGFFWYKTPNQFVVFGVMDMTIQEIKIYLKKHFSLIFKYQSEYYSLVRSQSLFCVRYSLIATDTLHQQRNSLEELCEQVYISNGTLLVEAIKHMEIPEWDDPSWETYEAVRHSAIVHRNEIHFLYNQRNYWITHTHEGLSHLSDDLGNTQDFNSCRDLFEYARIDGNTLKDIWEKVIVDAC